MALNDMIKELLADADGEAISRSRVVDALLDLRLDANIEAPHLVDEIDLTLVDLPGRNLVATEWWVERLDALLLEADRKPEPA